MATKKATTKTTSPKTSNAKATKATKATAKKAANAKTEPAKAANAKPTAVKKAKAKAATNGDKKMSALDAAAKVLGESSEPMRAKEIIEQMTTKGYWTSPGGKTPHATVVAAIIREIRDKGTESRFKKADRGLFTANS